MSSISNSATVEAQVLTHGSPCQLNKTREDNYNQSELIALLYISQEGINYFNITRCSRVPLVIHHKCIVRSYKQVLGLVWTLVDSVSPTLD